jgi:hypothetical protein
MELNQTFGREKRPPGFSYLGLDLTAMNEALLLGSVRQHELAEAANLANEKLQAEIRERKQAEAEVRRLNAELERRVTERTAQMQAANDEL